MTEVGPGVYQCGVCGDEHATRDAAATCEWMDLGGMESLEEPPPRRDGWTWPDDDDA